MISPAETGRMLASCFALSAFAVAVMSGLAAGADAAQILQRAVMAMLICFAGGAIIGAICDRVIRSHLSEKSGDALDGLAVSASTNMSEEVIDAPLAEPASARSAPARAAA